MSGGPRAFSLFGADVRALEDAARAAVSRRPIAHVELRRGSVRVTLVDSLTREDIEEIRGACDARLGAARWSFEESVAAAVIGEARQAGATIATAESCTGGLVAAAVTSVSGSSDVFWGGFVTYANEAKQAVLGVNPATLIEHGAVSEPVVREMADGALRASGATLAVSVSGVAGPSGGTPAKPVGTVWICCARPDGSALAERYLFPGDRDAVRTASVVESLVLLRRTLDLNGAHGI